MQKEVIDLLFSSGIGGALALIIKAVVDHFVNKHKKQEEIKEKRIQNDISSDTYWENRFKGLKVDYEDRERYYEKRIEDIQKACNAKCDFEEEKRQKLQYDYDQLSEKLDEREEFIKSLEAKIIELTDSVNDAYNTMHKVTTHPAINSPEQIEKLDNDIG